MRHPDLPRYGGRHRLIRFGVQRKCSVTTYHATGLWATTIQRPELFGKPVRPAYIYIAQRWRFTIPRWVLVTVFRAISRYRGLDGRLVR